MRTLFPFVKWQQPSRFTTTFFHYLQGLLFFCALSFAVESNAQCNVSTLVRGGASEGANLVKDCSVCHDREADPYGCAIFRIDVSGFSDEDLSCGTFTVTLLPSTGQGYDIWDGDLRTFASCTPPNHEDVPNNQAEDYDFSSISGDYLYFSVCAQGEGNVSFDKDAFKIVPGIKGCTDPSACNYDPDARL